MTDWGEKLQAKREKDAADLELAKSDVSLWEPSYGFCATNEHDRVELAMTLEALRRQVCCYGGGNRCDCKYGLRPDLGADVQEFGVIGSKTYGNSEQTGCPELREIIHRLLHRDQPLI